jgi:hypothetical protein
MRVILLAGLALATAACGGGETEATDANMMSADNMLMDQNIMMDGNVMMDGNAMMGGNGSMDGSMNGMGAAGAANGAADAGTQNMMMKDAATNDPDTNLANGL